MASRTARRTRPMRGSSKDGPRRSGEPLLRFLIGIAILAWTIRVFIVQPFYIPSASMLPALYPGDYVAVAKWPFGYSRYSFPFEWPHFSGRVISALPKRGDLVVFRHPTQHSDLIKRVIGLPGDTVEVRHGELVLNGHPAARALLQDAAVPISQNSPCRAAPGAKPRLAQVDGRAACLYHAYLERLPGGPSYTVLDQIDGPADDFPATRVPQGRVFLMGDNRDDSLDSRFATADGGVGMLPTDNLVGRALLTFWSTDGSASLVKPWTWFTTVRARRIGLGYAGLAR